MKLRVLAMLRGAEFTANIGEVVTVDEAMAKILIDAGAAAAIPEPAPPAAVPEPDPAPEAAVLETPERAVLPSVRGRRMSEPHVPQKDDEAP